MNPNVPAIPPGMHSLTPHLVYRNAPAAMDFYVNAFGARDSGRLLSPDGKLMHGMMFIGDSALMLVEENPQWGMQSPLGLNGTPVIVHLYVEDVDATMAQAVQAGATMVLPAADMFWGDRYGQVRDPFGHLWSVATHIRDMRPEEIIAASKQDCGSSN